MIGTGPRHAPRTRAGGVERAVKVDRQTRRRKGHVLIAEIIGEALPFDPQKTHRLGEDQPPVAVPAQKPEPVARVNRVKVWVERHPNRLRSMCGDCFRIVIKVGPRL